MAKRILQYSGPIVTRAEAKLAGLKRYFTGRPCPHGHVSERSVANATCLECIRLRKRGETEMAAARNRIKIWRANNLERARLAGRVWVRNNKDRVVKKVKDWALANPERARENARARKNRRRAREYGVGVHYTGKQVSDLWSKVQHKCAACGLRLTLKTRHVDHIMPVARGGSNGIENIQFLCRSCNQSKSARDPVEFMQSIGMLL